MPRRRSSSARATSQLRCRRSPPRPASRSRPSIWRSRPRAESCGRSGTCSYAATRTRRRSPSASGTARRSRSPTRSGNSSSMRATPGPARNGSQPWARRSGPPPPPIPRSRRCGTGSRATTTRTRALIVESLAAKNALAPGLDVKIATDLLWTINHPTVWQLLVLRQGWAPEQYEEWCLRTACSQLLAGHGEQRDDR